MSPSSMTTQGATAPSILKKASEVREKALRALEEQGGFIDHNFFPQLNSLLIEAGEGAEYVCEVVSDVKTDAVPSSLNPDEAADTLVVRGMDDGLKFTFFASNKGIKGKIRGLAPGKFITIKYDGDRTSETKGYSDWHNFLVAEFAAANGKTAKQTAQWYLDEMKKAS